MNCLPIRLLAATLLMSQTTTIFLTAEAAAVAEALEVTAEGKPDGQSSSTTPLEEENSPPKEAIQSEKSLEPFTGKVSRNKVRMRLQPTLESAILRELEKDDLLIVIGEYDEFYAVKPLKDLKAYVFRTFVLDNIIEGDRVNVRLEPALESPVIGQLQRGDNIEGTISALNSKWLEIAPPETTRFYVCKEYVEKIGSPEVMAQMEGRRREVNELLHNAYLSSQEELRKDYPEINLDKVLLDFHAVITQYSDFSDQVARAKELLSDTQEQYLQKKIAYLESRASKVEALLATSPTAARENKRGKGEIDFGNESGDRAVKTEEVIEAVNFSDDNWGNLFDPAAMTPQMASWIPNEKRLYDYWKAEGYQDPSEESFYRQQLDEIVVLNGTLEPYTKVVKNKPGDFLLLSRANGSPIAFLYSTKVDLQQRVGGEVVIHALKRPNYNFAFPAYFVVAVE